MSYWQRFTTKGNFELAWRRINTGNNIYYKRFYRDAYLAYEISLEENLKSLLQGVKGHSYKPQQPDRIFIPKPSGLQRPITLLTIEDQIVWQAVANVLDIKTRNRRNRVINRSVFSNLPSSNRIFFFENWRSSYKRFISKIVTVYQQKKWVVYFDLAAYYDTISHDHIIKLINPLSPYSEISNFIRGILKRWSSEKTSFTFSHGIPQGPLASAFVGEVVFLDIDLHMETLGKNIIYLRYVDDIRILADTEDDARHGMIELEQLCRNKGLIPQSKKTVILEARTKQDAVGKDFSLSPDDLTHTMSQRRLQDSVDIETLEIKDVSKLRFFLFRAAPLDEYLENIFELFVKNPYLSDAFFAYLRRFPENQKLIRMLVDLMEKKKFPYQYVEGNAWQLLSDVDPNCKYSQSLQDRAKKRLFSKHLNVYLRYGLLRYLAPYSTSSGRKLFNKYVYEKSSIMQSLLLPYISRFMKSDHYINVLKQSLIRTKPEAGLVAVTQLAHKGIKFRGLALGKKIKPCIRHSLVGLGLTTSRVLPDVTPLQEIFSTRYNISILDWRRYLKEEYSQAHTILILAEKAFDMNRSSWLCFTDSFNNIIVRKLIELDSSITQATIGTDGKLVSYGNLISTGTPFPNRYPSVAGIFKSVHKRRCTVPQAHPYDIQTRRESKVLKGGEQKHLFGKLKHAYREINIAFENCL